MHLTNDKVGLQAKLLPRSHVCWKAEGIAAGYGVGAQHKGGAPSSAGDADYMPPCGQTVLSWKIPLVPPAPGEMPRDPSQPGQDENSILAWKHTLFSYRTAGDLSFRRRQKPQFGFISQRELTLQMYKRNTPRQIRFCSFKALPDTAGQGPALPMDTGREVPSPAHT